MFVEWSQSTMFTIRLFKGQVMKCQRLVRRGLMKRDKHLLFVLTRVKEITAHYILRYIHTHRYRHTTYSGTYSGTLHTPVHTYTDIGTLDSAVHTYILRFQPPPRCCMHTLATSILHAHSCGIHVACTQLRSRILDAHTCYIHVACTHLHVHTHDVACTLAVTHGRGVEGEKWE